MQRKLNTNSWKQHGSSYINLFSYQIIAFFTAPVLYVIYVDTINKLIITYKAG